MLTTCNIFLGLTAIEIWMIGCVLFVFGALTEYAAVLLKVKIATTRNNKYHFGKRFENRYKPVPDNVVVCRGPTIMKDPLIFKLKVRKFYTNNEKFKFLCCKTS